jgi:hypothetical protein
VLVLVLFRLDKTHGQWKVDVGNSVRLVDSEDFVDDLAKYIVITFFDRDPRDVAQLQNVLFSLD